MIWYIMEISIFCVALGDSGSYLTIKDWKMDMDAYLLDYPNEEVRQGIASVL